MLAKTPIITQVKLKTQGIMSNLHRKMILEMLLSKGSKINKFAKKNLWTPIHWLCLNGDKESILFLISQNAIFFTPDYKGSFAIDFAGRNVFNY